MAERHTVDVDVEGSKPFSLPKETRILCNLRVFVFF